VATEPEDPLEVVQVEPLASCGVELHTEPVDVASSCLCRKTEPWIHVVVVHGVLQRGIPKKDVLLCRTSGISL
jgi:hypothetical protein